MRFQSPDISLLALSRSPSPPCFCFPGRKESLFCFISFLFFCKPLFKNDQAAQGIDIIVCATRWANLESLLFWRFLPGLLLFSGAGRWGGWDGGLRVWSNQLQPKPNMVTLFPRQSRSSGRSTTCPHKVARLSLVF